MVLGHRLMFDSHCAHRTPAELYFVMSQVDLLTTRLLHEHVLWLGIGVRGRSIVALKDCDAVFLRPLLLVGNLLLLLLVGPRT